MLECAEGKKNKGRRTGLSNGVGDDLAQQSPRSKSRCGGGGESLQSVG